MARLGQLIPEKDLKIVEKAKNEARVPTVGSELINNLLYRLNRRNNTVVEMDGHYVKRVRISLSSNFFNPKEKHFNIWAKPFIRGNYLMLNIQEPMMLKGLVVRASDIFGTQINSVNIPK